MNKYYFTFGTEGQLKKGGYILIYANSIKEAQEKFIKRYGDRAWKGENILNYAFHYTEEEFKKTDMQYGWCHECIGGPKEVLKVVQEAYGDWIYYQDGTKEWRSIGD